MKDTEISIENSTNISDQNFFLIRERLIMAETSIIKIDFKEKQIYILEHTPDFDLDLSIIIDSKRNAVYWGCIFPFTTKIENIKYVNSAIHFINSKITFGKFYFRDTIKIEFSMEQYFCSNLLPIDIIDLHIKLFRRIVTRPAVMLYPVARKRKKTIVFNDEEIYLGGGEN